MGDPSGTVVLTDSQLESLVDLTAVIGAVEEQFCAAALGTTVVAVQPSLQLPGRTGKFLAMVALADQPRLAAVKLLADLPDNPAAGRPAQRSTIMLLDADTGACLAVLAGRVPTRDRTAAASAVATRHLANPGARVLGLVGAGALAAAHVRSHAAVLDLDEVLVWSRTVATIERLRASVADLGVPIRAVDQPQAVFEADVVCTLTPARTPVVAGAWFRPGQHVNVVGAPPRADHREVDDEAVVRATVFVDDLPTALAKSGDVRIPLDRGVISEAAISNELGAVVAGRIQGRADAAEITLFDSVGLASQDLAVCALLLAAARERGVGTVVDFAS